MPQRRSLPAFLALALVAAPVLLAGCTEQVDAAKQELEQAKEGLAKAQQEIAEAREAAQQARDRYERVRSLTIVRTEKVDLVLTPVVDAESGDVSFEPNATRNGVAVPRANITALPPIVVRLAESPYDGDPLAAGDASFVCDPLSCVIRLRSNVLLAFENDARGFAWQVDANGTLLAYREGSWWIATPTDFGFALDDASVLATTSAGDATS